MSQAIAYIKGHVMHPDVKFILLILVAILGWTAVDHIAEFRTFQKEMRTDTKKILSILDPKGAQNGYGNGYWIPGKIE